MADWVDALALHIAANGLGVAADTLFVGTMIDTDQPGPVVGLGEYKGREVETMGSNGVDVPMLQIAVRAPSYEDAKTRIAAVRNLLRAITNQTVQGTHFVRVQPDGNPKDVGRDDKGRQQFTADFEVWINA